jgi:hypothetical protein
VAHGAYEAKASSLQPVGHVLTPWGERTGRKRERWRGDSPDEETYREGAERTGVLRFDHFFNGFIQHLRGTHP